MKFFKSEEKEKLNNNIYDSDGYDSEGYNKDGYDRFGYNRLGLDKKGFNREGFDKEGYDRNGYDINGYDREGLDLYGFNKDGYDHLGYDRFGYNKEGYDRYDYDKYGYNKEGYDAHGYDKEGFNKEGLNKDGKTKEEVNLNKYDKNGYDKEGFNKEGYNHLGFNRYGYNKKGYDINGYDRRGFNELGINKNNTKYDDLGFDIDGYDINGFNRYGINKDGVSRLVLEQKKDFDKIQKEYLGKTVYHEIYGKGKVISIKANSDYKSGYLKIEFDRTFTREFLFPDSLGNFISDTNIWNKNEEEMTYYDHEFKKEKKYLNKVLEYTEKKEEEEYKAPILVRDNSWNNPYDEDYDPQETEDNFYTKSMRKYWNKVSLNPFFASIKTKEGLLYIGKEKVSDLVYDWRDKKSSPYYMYNSLINNSNIDLSLVRNHTIEYKRYKGFIDLFNKDSQDTVLNKNTTDEYLTRLLNESRVSKVTHDIITSIQNKQYEIIANLNNENILVNGCAGSGKTMILYHKIAYNAFNNKNFNPNHMCVISSNLLLKREGDILAKELKIDKIRNYDLSEFYNELIISSNNKNKGFFILNKMNESKNNDSIYNKEFLNKLEKDFNLFINSNDLNGFILNDLKIKVKSIFNKDINMISEINDLFNNSEYENILKLFSKIPLVNVMESKILDKNFLSFLMKNFESYFKDTIEYNLKGDVKKKGYSYEEEFKEFLKSIEHKGKISIYNEEIKQVKILVDLYDYIKLKEEIKAYYSYLAGNKKAYLYSLVKLFLNINGYINISDIDYRFLLIYLAKEYKKDYPFIPTIYIDEYQNYSLEEFNLLKDIYDYASFSLFGDLKQKIDKKGINDISLLPFSFTKYDLNINYRNAKEICEYLNKRFDTNMVSIGVKGLAEEQPKSIELYIDEEDDRTALIVKSFEYTKDLRSKNKSMFIDVLKEDHILKNQINILLIDDVKGLEFEKVYVYEKGLTEEEKYLASSRALWHLTVIKE